MLSLYFGKVWCKYPFDKNAFISPRIDLDVHDLRNYYRPRERVGKDFTNVCMPVCLSVQAIAFESFALFLACE